MSPEAYKRKFSKKSDSWAIGIILYEMLTQKLPYNATGHELTKLIKKGEYNIKQLQNTLSISKESKSLINALLTVDEDKRISVDDALNSKWLKKFEDDVKTINNNITRYFENNDIVNNLRNFNKFSNFKKEILFYIAKTSVEDEIIELKKKIFLEFDKSNNGSMEKDEINEIFRMLRISTSEEELNIICDSLDFHKDGNVNYTEFLAASLSSEFFLKEEKLKFVFKFFDRFNNNYITPQDIIKVTKYNYIPINEE